MPTLTIVSTASAPHITAHVERAKNSLARGIDRLTAALGPRQPQQPDYLMRRIVPQLRSRGPATGARH